MSLADFLGSTSEIKIIDFLAENMDMAYNQTEISECLGISRTVVNQKIPVLIYNNIIEIKEFKGNTKKYGLKENSLVNKIIATIYDHSFRIAEYEVGEEEILSEISDKYQASPEEKCDCYCGDTRYIEFNELQDYSNQYYGRLNRENGEDECPLPIKQMWSNAGTEYVSA
ncbi:MAG: hypothetical protein QM426_11025 [Euryarchaeota archaeon]|nr:hypothetical protein [Euryarchaeota archaeon]